MTDHGMLCKSPFGYMAYQYKSLFKIGGKTTNQIYSGEKNVGKNLGDSVVTEKRCEKLEAIHQQFLFDVYFRTCIESIGTQG